MGWPVGLTGMASNCPVGPVWLVPVHSICLVCIGMMDQEQCVFQGCQHNQMALGQYPQVRQGQGQVAEHF